MHDNLASAVRDRVDAHLDAVEKQLEAAGANRTKRRSVLDDLETQILDMLAVRNSRSPTLTDVEAVLASLDPPSAYANSGSVPVVPRQPATTPPVAERRLCPAVKKGIRYFAVTLIGALVLVLTTVGGDFERAGAPPQPSEAFPTMAMKALLVGAALAMVVGPLLATVCGWIATKRIRRSDGREYGLGLAVVEALLFPTLIIWVAAFALSGPGAGFIERFAAPALLTAGLLFLLRWSSDPQRNAAGRGERSDEIRNVPLASN
jgi:hypothetical protein